MPKRKDDGPDTEIVRIRLPLNVVDRCNKARLNGLRKYEAQSSFYGFLVELGLIKYEKSILPLEIGEDEGIHAPIKKEEIS